MPFVARGGYPPPYDRQVAGRERKQLGDQAGLTQFGVNLVRLPPGIAPSLRHWHWHENQDEFVFVVEGELALVENEGETFCRPGTRPASRRGSPTATGWSTGQDARRSIWRSERARRMSARTSRTTNCSSSPMKPASATAAGTVRRSEVSPSGPGGRAPSSAVDRSGSRRRSPAWRCRTGSG
ncbi:cupin domain-containing protein [Phenylobacterium sp.]|uniref:cupin domain-containing protein n=1 Tax=Phenylobacterium sp. TaxID=1871053 RepID=UPI0035B4C57D